jgi:hypothetical protein
MTLAVNFGKEILTSKDCPEKQFVPILDSISTLEELENKLKEIKGKYNVHAVFLAGDSIVGSCTTPGDYVCLVAEIEPFFDIEAFKVESKSYKLASHVVWLSCNVAEMVDLFIDGDVVTDGFLALSQRVKSFCEDSGSWHSCYRNNDPGCNFAIFTIEVKAGKYQLNFVEIK